MARLRNNLRESSRFNGLYDSGYQYSPPERLPLKFGPWDKLLPHGRRALPKNALAHLKHGILVDGVVFPSWAYVNEVITDATTLGAYDLHLIAGAYHAIFYIDTDDSDELKIELTNATTEVTVSTGLTSVSDGFVTAVGAENSIYYSHPDLSNIYKYDVLTGTTTKLTESNEAKFLFFLDNNLCGIRKDGSAFVLDWAVDGDTADWDGYGSGSEVIPGYVGEVQGVAMFNGGALIAGSNAGWFMQSTNTIPAFRFDGDRVFPGTPFENALTSTHNAVYFVDADRKLKRYDGSSLRDSGEGETRFGSDPVVYYSSNLNLVIVSTSDPEKVLFLDPESNQWVADLDETWVFVTDSPSGGLPGKVIGIKSDEVRTILDLTNDTYTMPTLTTGMVKFEQPLMVHYIDLQHTEVITKAPLADFALLNPDGTITVVDFNEVNKNEIQLHGQTARYFIDAICYGIEVRTSAPGTTEGFHNEDGLDEAGNLVSTGIPTVPWWRGDLNSSGNLVATEDSVGYTFGEFDEDTGNQEAVQNLNQWATDIGIAEIVLFARSLTNAPDGG